MSKRYEIVYPLNNLLLDNWKEATTGVAYIQKENRLKHLLILGREGADIKNSYATVLIPQDLMIKDMGCTIIANGKYEAMYYYVLAKRYNRDVELIKPSMTDIGKRIFTLSFYNKEHIQKEIIDYAEMIHKKKVVIIDMEFMQYGKESVQFVQRMLKCLQDGLLEENEEKITPHVLYAKDAHLYFSGLHQLLYRGAEYGLSCNVFLDARDLLTSYEKGLAESFLQNMVILNNLSLEDTQYVGEKVYEKQRPYIVNRPPSEFMYLTKDKDGKRISGIGRFRGVSVEDNQSIIFAINRYKGSIIKAQTITESLDIYRSNHLPKAKPSLVVAAGTGSEEFRKTTPMISKSTVSLVTKAKVEVQEKKNYLAPNVQEENHTNQNIVVVDDGLFDDEEEYV